MVVRRAFFPAKFCRNGTNWHPNATRLPVFLQKNSGRICANRTIHHIEKGTWPVAQVLGNPHHLKQVGRRPGNFRANPCCEVLPLTKRSGQTGVIGFAVTDRIDRRLRLRGGLLAVGGIAGGWLRNPRRRRRDRHLDAPISVCGPARIRIVAEPVLRA